MFLITSVGKKLLLFTLGLSWQLGTFSLEQNEHHEKEKGVGTAVNI